MDHFSLERLSWELSVLSKAVAYKNLSGAAANVGISQPQLSRIVGKLESELKCVLLDRGSRRKSGWTPLAFLLAEANQKSVRALNSEVLKLLEGSEPRLVHVGALEGLIPLAAKFGSAVLTRSGVQTLELDVYDLHVLEERFFTGDLDFIFTAREPGRKKYRFSKRLGFQSLERVGAPERFRVMSSFEFGVWETRNIRHVKPARAASRPKEHAARTVISNSLAMRQHWIEKYGGEGTLPSPVREAKKRASDSQGPKHQVVEEDEVFLFGQDSVSQAFWELTSSFQSVSPPM